MGVKNGRALLAAGLVAIVGGAGFWIYHQSPEQVAARQLQQAAAAQASGQLRQAAELYTAVAESRIPVAPQGASGLRTLLDAARLQAVPGADAAQVLALAQRVRAAGQAVMPPKDLLALGWTLAEAYAAKDASGAKAVLDAIAPLETDKARLDTAADPLLARIVAAEPRNTAAAVQYAELLERRRDCSRCEELLTPHAAALSGTEGARILGRIYAAKGQLDQSYALLQPYTEDKLKVFSEREARYRETVASIEKGALETLRAGHAPQDFYVRYKAADESGQRELVGTYINERLSADASLKAQIQALRESSSIVPAALDLGIVTVQRATKLSDPAARNAQLTAAEKVFLSIRGAAGDTDGYRLYLGQVYYWLGKQDEGRKLFDELLKSHGRGYAILVNVSGLLRSVGALQDARSLIEEAYRVGKDRNEQWNAAHMRSVMHIDAEDELTWLERSDRSHGRVRASIHATRAQIAARRGDRAAARRDFQLAAAEYAKLPESTEQLNGSGLILLALYGLDGDPQHRDKALTQLDQALAMMPTDSILLLNNISAISSAAVAAIVGETIDLPLMRTQGDLGMLEFLHNDHAARDRVAAAVRDNAAVKKALSYAEKAILLAPRNPHSYSFAASLAAMLEDGSASKALAARAQSAKLDFGDIDRELKGRADGSTLQRDLEAATGLTRQLHGLLQQPAVQRQAATWAVVADRWVRGRVAMLLWGQPVAMDEVVDVARKARSRHPSAGTHSSLMEALQGRAAQRLMKLNPAFAASVSRHGRLLDVSTLITLHLDEDPEFRRLALADADVLEVMSLVRERQGRYPGKTSTWSWLLLRHVDEKAARALAAQLPDSAAGAARLELAVAFSPRHPETVIERYHQALASGDRAQAQRALDDARKAGIALPEVLGRQLKAG
jgi:hypothetical protein